MLKISVVTVCYNTAATIEKTMWSVLNQTYPNIEYIIIDGGSKDGTVDIIKKYADRLAYWVSEPDKGIYDAMNKGIAAATGDYINFMNAGDIFHNTDTVNNAVAYFDSDSDIIYGDCILKNMQIEAKAKPLSIISKNIPFCHQSTFIKTEYHKQHTFDVSFKISADYNFLYKSYFVYNAKFQYIPITVSDYDTTGISNNNYWILYKENLRVWGKKETFYIKIKIQYIKFKCKIKKILPQWTIDLIRKYRKNDDPYDV